MRAYATLIVPVAGALRGLACKRRFTADYWIVMGALAISTLAAATLLQAPGAPLRWLLRSGGIATWIAACMWIPLLVAADLRAVARHRHWLATSARWSMVFPIGMFSTSAQVYGRVEATSSIVRVGDWAMWVALAAWTIVARPDHKDSVPTPTPRRA